MSAHAPHLRADLNIVEQVYRDETTFVVKDPVTHGYFRFRPIEVRVMRLFDGVRSAADVAIVLVADGVRISASTVEGFARKLGKLGLLEHTLMERTTQQLERLRMERQRQRSLFRGELFRMRWSFGDPDAMLTRLYPRVRWCFTPTFVMMSSLLFAAYMMIITAQGRPFAADVAAAFAPSSLSVGSILILLLAFSVLTLIHEMGHALSCKHFGGEVHEMGFMLLYFIPAFYANVNDAWSFQERRARLWVTAAGGWIELAVTAVFSIVWLVAAPGTLLSQFAVAAMLVGGLANILTNANPLIPLDGYFALSDWLEIPNLRLRAKEYVANWSKRHLLRMDVAEATLDSRERRIFLGYGLTAIIYRTLFLSFILFHVIAWVDRTIGAFPASLIVAMVLFGLRRHFAAMGRAVHLAIRSRSSGAGWRGRRGRVVLIALGGLAVTAFIPCALTTGGAFYVQPTASMVVTSPANGVVAAVLVREGTSVHPGTVLLQLINRDLAHEAMGLGLNAEVLALREQQARARQQTGAGDVLSAEVEAADALYSVARVRTNALQVQARMRGTVLSSRPESLTGRRVQYGDTLMAVGDLTQLVAVLRLRTAGAMSVEPGQRVRLVSYLDVAHPIEGVVSSVAPATGSSGAVEARMLLDAGTAWRAGATGEARVDVRRSTLFVAMWWALRSRVRTDVLM